MKQWICKDCGRRGETKDDKETCFCLACTGLMREVTEDDKRFQV